MKNKNNSNVASPKPSQEIPPRPIPPFFGMPFENLSQDVANFGQSAISSEPFDNLSSLNNNKPEVIAVSDFIPCYDDYGKQNSFGEFLQVKQDSVLISCANSINQLINLESFSFYKQQAENSRKDIHTFCQNFALELVSILSKVESTKTKFLFSKDPEVEEIKLLIEEGSISSEASNPESIFSLDSILSLDKSTWSEWTSTKIWAQSCEELKEVIKNGSPNGPLTINKSGPPLTNDEKGSYKLTEARSSKFKKFSFNPTQISFPEVFDQSYKISESQNFNSLRSKLISALTIKEYSVFNIPMSDLGNKNSAEKTSESIARLSYLICKELKFSNDLKNWQTQKGSDFFNLYGYAISRLNFAGNVEIWDYLIGKNGSDITEISTSPLGNGNSLISLGQSLESSQKKSYEVLTFEDRFINDDVGKIRDTSVLTPGTYYYVESALTFSNVGFDTNRTSGYVDKLEKSLKLCDRLNYLNFDFSLVPRSIAVITGAEQPSGYGSSKDYSGEFLEHPALLLREIEQRLLKSSGLLERSQEPKLITNNKSEDYSNVLINFGMTDYEVMSLLFMYCIGKANTKIGQKSNDPYSDVSYFEVISGQIKKALVSKTEYKEFSSPFFGVSVRSVDIQKIFDDSKLENLNRIADFLVDINSFIESSNGFVSSGGTSDSKSLYTGIQKTSLIFSAFYLCCLMVSSATPEKISCLTQFEASQYFLIEKSQEKNYLTTQEKNYLTITIDQDVFINTYTYDKIINSSEVLVMNEVKNVRSFILKFTSFLSLLKLELKSFLLNLNKFFSSNSDFFKSISDLIKDQQILSSVFTKEQMKLIESKFLYLSTRCKKEYLSELNQIAPYFLELKDKNIDSFLPIEDCHIASWNLFLKDYLKKPAFYETEGFNKKILSIGLPQKLYRRLKSNIAASNLVNSTSSRDIISVNVYMIDMLRPSLVHKPQKFLFDISKYPIRALNYYTDKFLGGKVNQNKQQQNVNSTIKFLPFFNFEMFEKKYNIQAENFEEDLSESGRYSFLQDNVRKSLIENHISSFMMEEYLRFTSGNSFDEQAYCNYSPLSVNNYIGLDPSLTSPGEVEYFKKNTFLSDIDSFKASLILPKKFDRVFHIIFDPDDFEINEEKTKELSGDYGNKSPLTYYEGEGFIQPKQGSNPIKRPKTLSGEVTFNNYYVEIQTYDY